MAVSPYNAKSSWDLGSRSAGARHHGKDRAPDPARIRDVSSDLALPRLPSIEARMITRSDLSSAASELRVILESVVRKQMMVRSRRG
jgi:hypothetical protein